MTPFSRGVLTRTSALRIYSAYCGGWALQSGGRGAISSIWSHFIYFRDGVAEIVNIQEGVGDKAKAYQVKQVRDIITRYQLSVADEAK